MGRPARLPLALGCSGGDGLPREAISGTIILDDRPLAEGLVTFEPAPGSLSGTAAGAEVRDGEFEVGREDGPVPGRYEVRLYASSGRVSSPGPGGSAFAPNPMVDLVPARYNSETTLEVIVAPGRANRFRFELSTAPMAAGGRP